MKETTNSKAIEGKNVVNQENFKPEESKKDGNFTPVEQLRKQARENVKAGAVTEGYTGDKEAVIKMLNEALATELVCVLRYRKHYFMAKGLDSEPVAEEFLAHSNEEQGHADKIALRITQLGGDPDLNPDRLTLKSHAEYKDVKTLEEMIFENLVAERIAIDSYREMIEFVASCDPTTRRILEEILEVEEEHADELADLIS